MKLRFLDARLYLLTTIVRGFDNARRESMDKIDLVLEIGLAQFQITCQVMNFSNMYNLLLRQAWIHAFNSIPFSLHQILRFIVTIQLITVFAEHGCTMIVNSGSKGKVAEEL